MRRCFLMIVVLACSAPVLSQANSSKPVSAFEQQLIDREKQFLQADMNKDVTAIDHAVADDFQGIQNNGDFYDRDDLIEPDSGLPKDTRAYDFRVFKLNDNSAVVAYDLIVPGEHPRYRHMADTWAKAGGHWQLKFRQITPNIWSADDTD
jgi:hypothetical protein